MYGASSIGLTFDVSFYVFLHIKYLIWFDLKYLQSCTKCFLNLSEFLKVVVYVGLAEGRFFQGIE